MVLEMKIPSPGESITEVEISQWLVKDGDIVNKDQTIAEIDSDKATLDLPAEATGKITLKAEEGDSMSVGDIVCLIDTSEASNAKASNSESPQQSIKDEKKIEQNKIDEISITPLARNIASDKGIDINEIDSKGDKITKDDVLKVVPAMGSSNHEGRSENREKLSMLRRKVSERLVSVKNETAMLTTFNEADLSNIFNLRKKYKEAFSQKHGVSLGFMSFFTRACALSLQKFPKVNAFIDGEEMVMNDFVDVSIAVSSPKGLMVPVMRNVENMTLWDIESEVKRLAIKARDGKLSIPEMTGGTFTITNGGVFGSMLSTPIINPPQSAILGMHNIVERPVVEKGNIVARPVMYVALSYDHRIIDGKESVGFLVSVKNYLENPETMLMGKDPMDLLMGL